MEIDPELERQINAAKRTQGNVEAVLLLRADVPTDPALLLERATAETKQSPEDYNVLPNLGVLVISAKPELLEYLLKQPEIETAGCNRLPPKAPSSKPQRRTR
jgi:chaperonin cofactor prefoldin